MFFVVGRLCGLDSRYLVGCSWCGIMVAVRAGNRVHRDCVQGDLWEEMMFTLFASIQSAFAGVTAYIVHWGFFGSLAAGLVLAGVFSQVIPFIGPYLTPIRRDLYWAAFGCVLIMFGMFIGSKDATNRCVAKQVIITKVVTKAVNKAKTPASRQRHDRWDKPEY